MKHILLMTFCLFEFAASAQSIHKQLKKIKTPEEARAFVKANPSLDAELLAVIYDKDTTGLGKILLKKKVAEVFTKDNYTYKIIESTTTLSFRASYIYLDGNKLSMQAIDSLRSVILRKYENGTSFQVLVQQYTMDRNPTGDLGWFTSGMMVKDFENAVRAHKLNDIFTIDIPANKWYYVTLKTHEDQTLRRIKVLKVKSKDN
jgi:parvulin-like peptidyl-prolyl isomerase